MASREQWGRTRELFRADSRGDEELFAWVRRLDLS